MSSRRLAAVQAALAAASLVAAAALPSAVARPVSPTAVIERAHADRPDEVSGPQVHVVYAIPADGRDAGLDVNGAITSSVASFGKWLIGQTGGRWLRTDTFRGHADVTFLRLSASAAEVASPAHVGQAFVAALTAAGMSRSANKAYLVYYGGTSDFTCGGLFTSPSVDFGVVFLERPGACGYEPLAPGWPAVADARVPDPDMVSYVALHETLHVLGFVPRCAPHYESGHVNDDRHDIMSTGYERPLVLDARRDDYYLAPIPNCPDLADSPYLVDAPRYRLDVTTPRNGVIVVGEGSVAARCPPTCSVDFPAFADVTVRAEAARAFAFERWSGSCSGGNPCVLQMTKPETVSAEFAPRRYALRVTISGKGSVAGRGAPIACPARCSARVGHGSRVTLRARPHAGWRLSSWTRPCKRARSCAFTVTRNTRVHATFRPRPGD